MPQRTILVTGGAGHVGSHVIELLVADDRNRVISLDNYSNGSRANHITGAEYRDGHTKDIARLVPETPDIIFHLGEYARIATSFEDAATVYDFNIVGTFGVVEFCRARRVPKLVYAASSTKFAIEGDGRHQNPYSFTKATNVDLINDYGRWFGLPYAICYFYNAFGPRERGDGRYATLIAKFESLRRAGRPLEVVSPGTQRRSFTYVKDLARGIILVGEKGQGDGYALRADATYSVMDIARAFGGEIEMVQGYPGRQDVADDPTRARDELGWKPTLDVMDYIREFTARQRS
ncbi:MAG TPA: NAD-dependent epimerase/dehydratase family protein [Gemmatimonadaceae bacterium]|jgi:UDP-glucose 4-epimerase|nr:NAD-dependent epimerase/dehydratase family protein [Gemmatimonadaceae bacterium]